MLLVVEAGSGGQMCSTEKTISDGHNASLNFQHCHPQPAQISTFNWFSKVTSTHSQARRHTQPQPHHTERCRMHS